MDDIRRARDTDDLRPLWNTAFLPDEVFFTRDYRPERALIVTDGPKPVSMLHILPRTLLLENASLRAGYIMGVATDPAYRGQGLAGNLITAAVGAIEKDGCDCAMLIPASASLALYYRRFGFTLRGAMPCSDQPPAGQYPAGSDDIPKLSVLYDTAFPCRAERDSSEWETILQEYTVCLGADSYTVADERGTLERIPVLPGSPDCDRAACIKPFCLGTEALLTKNRPYINLLYT